MHMYHPSVKCGQNMVSLGCMVVEKLTSLHKLNINLIRSINHENEVMVRCQVPGCHVPSMISVWNMYGESRLYGNRKTDLIMM